MLFRIILITGLATSAYGADFLQCKNEDDCHDIANSEYNDINQEYQCMAGYTARSSSEGEECVTDCNQWEHRCVGKNSVCDPELNECVCLRDFHRVSVSDGPYLDCAPDCHKHADCGFHERCNSQKNCTCQKSSNPEDIQNIVTCPGPDCSTNYHCGDYEACDGKTCVCYFGTTLNDFERPVCKRAQSCDRLTDNNCQIRNAYCTSDGSCNCSEEYKAETNTNKVLLSCKRIPNYCTSEANCPDKAYCSDKRCKCLPGYETSSSFAKNEDLSCYKSSSSSLSWIAPLCVALTVIPVFSLLGIVIYYKRRRLRQLTRTRQPCESSFPSCTTTSPPVHPLPGQTAYDNPHYTHEEQPPAYEDPPPAYEQVVASSQETRDASSC